MLSGWQGDCVDQIEFSERYCRLNCVIRVVLICQHLQNLLLHLYLLEMYKLSVSLLVATAALLIMLFCCFFFSAIYFPLIELSFLAFQISHSVFFYVIQLPFVVPFLLIFQIFHPVFFILVCCFFQSSRFVTLISSKLLLISAHHI